MKFEKFCPGMTVYSVGRQKMGNTTISTVVVWPVTIVSTDTVKQAVVARRNGNKEQTFYENTWSKWREKEPVLVNAGFGRRLATREELKAMKAAKEGGAAA